MESVGVVHWPVCRVPQTRSILGVHGPGSVFSGYPTRSCIMFRPIKLGYLSLEWRMSTDKYPSIFMHQMETVVYWSAAHKNITEIEIPMYNNTCKFTRYSCHRSWGSVTWHSSNISAHIKQCIHYEWLSHDLSKGWSFRGINLKHAENKLLEILTVPFWNGNKVSFHNFHH